MKIDGAIFDMDGTLLNSMSIWETIGEDYLITKGIKPKSNLRQILKPMSLHQAALYFIHEYKISDAPEKICADINHMIEDFYLFTASPKDGAADFVKRLAVKGTKMCIATATDIHLAEAALTRCGMMTYFRKIFTCSSVGYGKDKPNIYNEALKYLGTNIKYTYVFEDAFHAAQTAKSAGFKIVGVFDEFENETVRLKTISDIYLNSFSEGAKIFQNS